MAAQTAQTTRLGRLAHFTARHRWPVIGAWVVLTLFGGFAAGQRSPRWVQSLAVPGKPAPTATRRAVKGFRGCVPPPHVAGFPHHGDATHNRPLASAAR